MRCGPLRRHAELVSASTAPQAPRPATWWTLKQVQGDGVGKSSQLHPLPDRLVDVTHRIFGTAHDLACDILAADATRRAMGEHDRADHRDEQHKARALENIEI